MWNIINPSREVEIFEYNHAVPFSKYVTLYKASPFTITASYVTPPTTYPQTHIGKKFVKSRIPYIKSILSFAKNPVIFSTDLLKKPSFVCLSGEFSKLQVFSK